MSQPSRKANSNAVQRVETHYEDRRRQLVEDLATLIIRRLRRRQADETKNESQPNPTAIVNDKK
jgi:dihydroneopterin aldolase